MQVRAQRRGRTGTIVVLVDVDGERTFLPDRAAAADFGEVSGPDLDDVAVLHVPAYGLQGGRTATSVRALLALAASVAMIALVRPAFAKRLHGGLTALGFQLGTTEPQSAIVAVIMPDLERGAMMWEALLKEGLYVNLARPPATPANMTLLRCSLCAEHTAEEVETILGMFERAGKAVGII